MNHRDTAPQNNNTARGKARAVPRVGSALRAGGCGFGSQSRPCTVACATLLFAVLAAVFARAEIFTRLAPSARLKLDSAGATLLYTTEAVVNGRAATLGAFEYPAPPDVASIQVPRLLGLPQAPHSTPGIITQNGRTHVIVLPVAADSAKSIFLLTQFANNDAADVAFPKDLPHPANATPTFAAVLENTRTTFASATSAASPQAVLAEMDGLLRAKRWQPAAPATASQTFALYSRDNAVFAVLATAGPGGATRLSLLQRLTSQ